MLEQPGEFVRIPGLPPGRYWRPKDKKEREQDILKVKKYLIENEIAWLITWLDLANKPYGK